MPRKPGSCWQMPPEDPERPAPVEVPPIFDRGRRRVSLDGTWGIFADPMRVGRRKRYWLERRQERAGRPVEMEHACWTLVRVPGDWNTQVRELARYDGWCWYARRFAFRPRAGERLFLRFGAVNYLAEVWLNGLRLGAHEGGFTPFEFEVTGQLRARNLLVVRADSTLRPEAAPTRYFDWFNYGGITRPVELLRVPRTFVRQFRVALAERRGRSLVRAEVVIDGPRPPRAARLEIPELGLRGSVPLRGGRGAAEFPAEPERWSPESPRLYAVRLSAGADRVDDSVGFRTLATRGRQVLLNGRPVFLRGACLHEERPVEGGGRTLTDGDLRGIFREARALGCNFLRLAHYPHSERVARLADRLGILLWEEIPVYWDVQFENPATLAACRGQLREMIWRDYNRASVLAWSVGNETPRLPARDRFFEALVRQARALDRTRLVTAAFDVERGRNDFHRGIFSTVARRMDLVGLNEYFGWYELNRPGDLERVRWDLSVTKAPVILSEFGAEALAGRHGRPGERWTEEDQASVYRRQLRTLARQDWCAGLSPWLLIDFRSHWRAGRHQRGYNRKGLLGTGLRRKLAFGVLREFYERKRTESRPAGR